MAGPLMPQWVSNRAPEARNLVPARETAASVTTVPMSDLLTVGTVKVKSDGMGCFISRP